MIKSVLIVLKHLNFGGTERYAINLANDLVKRNISVVIVAGKGPYAPYISPKVKLFFAPISRKGRNNHISEKIIFDIAKKYKPDVIHAQCRNSLVCCQLARRALKIPVVTHEHLEYKSHEYAFVVDELNTNSDKVITIVPHIAQKLVRYGLAKTKVETIHNGINITDFPLITKKEKDEARTHLNLQNSDKVILCLSRIVPGKGIDRLLEAFMQVLGKVPEAKLVIAGDDEWGFTKLAIEEQIAKNALHGKVQLYPAQFNIRKFHAAASIFCYPPINRGMAVMEAMASGLPIVAKQSPTKPTVAENNIHGLLVQTDDVKELADKLTSLLQTPGLTIQMGKAARKRIQRRFNLDMMITNILHVYTDVIDANEILPKNPFVSDNVVALPL